MAQAPGLTDDISPGFTFMHTARSYDGGHLWMVIPEETSLATVAVTNFTTAGRIPDRTCPIYAGGHPFVVHGTLVNYPLALMKPVAALRAAGQDGTITVRERIAPELLLRIQEGALLSLYTPPAVEKAVRATLGR